MMRVFVTIVLIIFAGTLWILYAQEAAQNQIDQKQIANLTQRVSTVEAQTRNLMVLKYDMRTLDVKIDTLREVLTVAANPPTTSLPAGTDNVPASPPTPGSPPPAQE